MVPQPGLGVPPRTLVIVFAVMVGLFAFTTVLARWYGGQRVRRAERYYAIGKDLAGRVRPAEAIEEYRNALIIAPGDAKYRLAIGEELMKIGRLNEAAIYFQELLETDPADGFSNLMLARIAARRGRNDAAVNYYHRAIFGYWPREAERRRIEARWEVIDLLARTGAAKQVVAELLEIADQAPNDAATLKRAGRMLLRYGSAKQAADTFHQALRVNGRDADAQLGLGDAELALGDYRAAETAFRRTLREAPHSDAARTKLAQIEEVLSLDPTRNRLSAAERHRRSRALAERSLAALEKCLAGRKVPPEDAVELAASARKSLGARRRGRSPADSADAELALAEQLWSARQAACGAAPAPDAPLARVMARLSR